MWLYLTHANPKRRWKDINFRWIFLVFLGFWPKRHQFLMTFPCVFRFLTKNARKSHRKLMSFWRLLDWILKMRGLYVLLSMNSGKVTTVFLRTFSKKKSGLKTESRYFWLEKSHVKTDESFILLFFSKVPISYMNWCKMLLFSFEKTKIPIVNAPSCELIKSHSLSLQ